MGQAVQIVGALLVLAGFVLAQLDVLDQRSYVYLVPNLLGSSAMTVTGVLSGDWGFVFLEGAWAVVSLVGVAQILGYMLAYNSVGEQVAEFAAGVRRHGGGELHGGSVVGARAPFDMMIRPGAENITPRAAAASGAHDPDLGLVHPDGLAGADLGRLAQFHDTVHAHQAGGHERLAGAAAVGQPGELEQLVELDELPV